jgi:hypothetical protein
MSGNGLSSATADGSGFGAGWDDALGIGSCLVGFFDGGGS